MKKEFVVQDGETIDQCLQRMEREGFRPVRRLEKPIFKEVKENGKNDVVPATQKIVFIGEKTE